MNTLTSNDLFVVRGGTKNKKSKESSKNAQIRKYIFSNTKKEKDGSYSFKAVSTDKKINK